MSWLCHDIQITWYSTLLFKYFRIDLRRTQHTVVKKSGIFTGRAFLRSSCGEGRERGENDTVLMVMEYCFFDKKGQAPCFIHTKPQSLQVQHC
jgi:hypothetical protein